jgi:hypothetical protein
MYKKLWTNFKDIYSNNIIKIKEYVDSKINSFDSLKAYALTCFILYYGRVFTIFSDKCKKLYNNNSVVKNCFHQSSYYLKYIYSFLISKKIEPNSFYWISTSVLSTRNKNRFLGEEYTLLESYEFIKNPLNLIKNSMKFEIIYNETCDAVDSIVLNNQNYIEGLVKMKIGYNYVIRIFDNKNGQFDEFKLPIIPSKTKFLSIEYTHPIMKKGIFIDLDRSVYLVGNQILSPAFVKNYLEYQSEIYHFDLDYVVKIIDSDVNNFEIGCDKSILLIEDGFKVI